MTIVRRAAATTLLGCVLALTLVVTGPAKPAAALDGGDFVKIGKTVGGGGAITRTVGAAACTTGVGCAAIGLVGVGMLAYETKDHWLPVVKGLFGGAKEGGQNGGSCTLSASVEFSGDGRTYSYTASNAGCSYGYSNAVSRCVGSSTYQMDDYGGLNTGETKTGVGQNVCPVGVSIAEVVVMLRNSTKIHTSDPALCGTSPYYSCHRSATKVPDDELTTTTTARCRLPDGSLQTAVEEVTGEGDKAPIPSCHERWPGSVSEGVEIKSGYLGDQEVIADYDLPAREDVLEQYPDCFDQAGAFQPSSCRVRVYVNGVKCNVGVTGCANWETGRADGDTVECRMASYVIPLRECDHLKTQYRTDTKTRTLTETTTDGKLQTKEEAKSGTDTTTGTPREGANPSGPSTNPDGETDPDTQSCFGDAWSLNPVDWVYVPVKCALLWAFVPPPGTFSGVITAIGGAWAQTPIGVVVSTWNVLVGAVTVPNPGGGCQGPPLTVSAGLVGGGDYTIYPFEACSDPMASVAGIVRAALSLFIYVGAVLASSRFVASAFGLQLEWKRMNDKW